MGLHPRGSTTRMGGGMSSGLFTLLLLIIAGWTMPGHGQVVLPPGPAAGSQILIDFLPGTNPGAEAFLLLDTLTFPIVDEKVMHSPGVGRGEASLTVTPTPGGDGGLSSLRIIADLLADEAANDFQIDTSFDLGFLLDIQSESLFTLSGELRTTGTGEINFFGSVANSNEPLVLLSQQGVLPAMGLPFLLDARAQSRIAGDDQGMETLYKGTAHLDILLSFEPVILGDQFRWSNPSGGEFTNMDNWDPMQVPDSAAHTAVFDLGDTYTVLFADDANMGSTQVLAGEVSFVLNGNTLTAGNGADTGLVVDGHLTTGGGTVNASAVKIGKLTNADGQLTVTGGFAGVPTQLNATAGIQIALASPGELLVEAGTKVVTSSVVVGAGAMGSATITGASSNTFSTLQASGDLIVGKQSSGALTVSEGGRTDVAGNLDIGGLGVVEVEGGAELEQSTVEVHGTTVIGTTNGGTGLLTILDGGKASLADLIVGREGSATILVSGVRDNQPSVLEFSAPRLGGATLGGNDGIQGTLLVLDGGAVRSPAELLVGFGGPGQLTVDGVNGGLSSSVEVQDLTVGDGSTAMATNGGLITVTSILSIDGNATFAVQGRANGIPSTVEVRVTTGVGATNGGTGLLNILDGAKASLADVIVGGAGAGTILVSGVRDGEPSLLEFSAPNRGSAILGGNDGIQGTLLVQDGGAVRSSAGLFVGFGGPGQLTVDGVNGQTPSSIIVDGLTIDDTGTATVSGGGIAIVRHNLEVGSGENSSAVLNYQTGKVIVGVGDVGIDGQMFIQSNGVLEGTGTLIGGDPAVAGSGVNNFAGTVRPGNSPGILTIEGNYTQAQDATLQIEIGGLTFGDEYDRLIVTGDALIDGRIVFEFIQEFAPKQGDLFDFLTVGGDVDLSGAEFAVQNLRSDFEFDITPTAGGFQMQALNDGVFVVPEPGTGAAVLMMAVVLGVRRHRGRIEAA